MDSGMKSGSGRPKVIAVLPAYNAAKTLELTVREIPPGSVDEIILVDDASRDDTVAIARRLGLTVFCHDKNTGYGGNQKTCYTQALARGAGVVVMLHPDHQYDPKIISLLTGPILAGEADAVFGSRMLGGGPLEGGMPLWKYLGNKGLTALENAVLGVRLTEYHSGYRAYSAELLSRIGFAAYSDKFVFDTEIIVDCVRLGARIREIPIRTRYFKDASTIGFWASARYAFSIFALMLRVALTNPGKRRPS